MTQPAQAYPLAWPPGWRRMATGQRSRARFMDSRRPLSVIDGVARVLYELERLGIRRDDCVISSNVPTRLDGLPRSDRNEPSDPGVAVYWRKGKVTQCMSVDRYDRVADNLAAVSATLEAMRAIERHGGASILDRAFAGFLALPSPEQWFQVLGLSVDASTEQIMDAHRRLAMQHHPDRGGDAQAMARINAARDAGLEGREQT